MSSPSLFSTKSDAAYAEVRRRILAGELAPGSVLDQYLLSDQMGMSITPLREALRRLRGEGLIDIDVHKNTRVAPLSAHEARELFEIRLALDPAAAELAAQRRTDADIKTLRNAAKHLVPVTRTWGEKGLLAHSAFHRAIYVASHNDNMITMLDGLWDKSDRYRRLGLLLPSGAENRERDFIEHRKMLEMIVDKDAPGVADLMRQHIRLSLTVAAIDALDEQLGNAASSKR
jgi:DNA-binding GntR family transcriptional regulator